MIDVHRLFGRHPRPRVVGVRPPAAVEQRLRSAQVAWLSTTGPDASPAVVPVWFVWDGESFVVFSKPHARKARNIRANPHVMLAIGEPDDDFDVQLVEGLAELLDLGALDPAALGVDGKYGGWLAGIGLGLDEFRATYGQAIRITPTRFLPWRGRTWIGQGRRIGGTLVPAV